MEVQPYLPRIEDRPRGVRFQRIKRCLQFQDSSGFWAGPPRSVFGDISKESESDKATKSPHITAKKRGNIGFHPFSEYSQIPAGEKQGAREYIGKKEEEDRNLIFLRKNLFSFLFPSPLLRTMYPDGHLHSFNGRRRDRRRNVFFFLPPFFLFSQLLTDAF